MISELYICQLDFCRPYRTAVADEYLNKLFKSAMRPRLTNWHKSSLHSRFWPPSCNLFGLHFHWDSINLFHFYQIISSYAWAVLKKLRRSCNLVWVLLSVALHSVFSLKETLLYRVLYPWCYNCTKRQFWISWKIWLFFPWHQKNI